MLLRRRKTAAVSLFGSKVITTSGFLVAILNFDLIRMSDTKGDGWVAFAVVENPEIGFGIAFLCCLEAKLLLLPVFWPPSWISAWSECRTSKAMPGLYSPWSKTPKLALESRFYVDWMQSYYFFQFLGSHLGSHLGFRPDPDVGHLRRWLGSVLRNRQPLIYRWDRKACCYLSYVAFLPS